MFQSTEAIEYGCEESIMINTFRFWIDKNIANEKHFNENRTWTYNSKKAMIGLFPFWTEKQIRRIIESLITQNVIIKGNFNKSSFDKTTWYAFKDEKKVLGVDFTDYCPNGHDGNAQMGTLVGPNGLTDNLEKSNGLDQMGNTIPVTNTIPNTETEEKKEKKEIPNSQKKDFNFIDVDYLKSLPLENSPFDHEGQILNFKNYTYLIKRPWEEIQSEAMGESACACDPYKKAVLDIMHEKYQQELNEEIAMDNDYSQTPEL
jgi:hypothetical protein